MITWDEYQQQALTTAIYPLSRELDYTILGLCSEVGEIGEAFDIWAKDFAEDSAYHNLLSEIGDNFWYCAAVADALKLPLSFVANVSTLKGAPFLTDHEHMRAIVTEVSKLAGILKKSIRDNDGFLSSAAQDKLVEHLSRTLWLLDALSGRFGSSRSAIMSKNLNKLADRKARGVLGGSGDAR